jgi:hypothetical protein
MTQADDNTALGMARIAYDAMSVSGLMRDCLLAGRQLELAFNQYLAANTYWENCITSTYCTVDESKLQTHWSTASSRISDYENMLTAMAP